MIDWNQFIDIIPDDWRITQGEGVKIAVIDSGINIHHQDFRHLSATANDHFFNNCNSINGVEDTDGHGTQCAGLICSIPSTNESISGIANKSEIYILKSNHEDYAAEPDYLIESLKTIIVNKIDVVSISIEFHYDDKYSTDFNNLFKQIHEQGTIIVIAAGDNEELLKPTLHFPANRNECITIGGVNEDFLTNNITSSFAKHLDFIIPSIPIYTTNIPDNNSYCQTAGSSFTTALISGICCLYLSNSRNQKINQDILKEQFNKFSVPFPSLFSQHNGKLLLSNNFNRLNQ
jgi:subtilisin family serine protease